MATGNGVNQGKSAFLEEFLPGNRDADLDAVNGAWSAAGHGGTISDSLLGKIRSRLKIPKKRRATGGTDAGSKAKGKAKPQKAKSEAKKAEEAPPQPDLQEDDKGPSKSAFVSDLLGREPGANLRKVNEAWASAGHEGAISPSIYYKIKRERGVTGESSPGNSETIGTSEPQASEAVTALGGNEGAPQAPEARLNPTATAASANPPVSGGVGRVVDEVEAGIDDLLFTLRSNGGMPEVEAALRAARRLLTRSNGA